MPHDLLLFGAAGVLVIVIAVISRRSGRGVPSAPSVPSLPGAQAGQDYHFRLAQLEARVSFLMETLGVVYDAPVDDQVRSYLARGLKIEAIQAYRSRNPGVGLKDAKDAVEALEAQIKAQQS